MATEAQPRSKALGEGTRGTWYGSASSCKLLPTTGAKPAAMELAQFHRVASREICRFVAIRAAETARMVVSDAIVLGARVLP